MKPVRQFVSRPFVVAAAFAFVAVGGFSFAQGAGAQRSTEGKAADPWLVAAQARAAARLQQLELRMDPALTMLTQANGSSRVIVELRVPWGLEGVMSDGEQAEQRSRIARTQDDVWNRLVGTHARLVHNFETIPFQVVEVSPQALERLQASDQVAGIELDRLAYADLAQSAPLVQADQAWAAGSDGTGIAVAILDTGVEASHSFFGGRVAAEACFSTTNGSATTLCPNGTSQQTGAGAAAPTRCSGVSGCDHGTHVAGIAAGSGASLFGVAKGASIIAVQVFSKFSTGLASYSSDQIRAMEHVYSLRTTYTIAAVNMSLGGGAYTSEADCDRDNTAVKTAIDNLRSAGIATVIASGNDGYSDRISEPGCISSAVAVGSTTKADAISSFTNSSSCWPRARASIPPRRAAGSARRAGPRWRHRTWRGRGR